MPNSLSPELTSLVQYIELNKAGWWDRAVQRLILVTIWSEGKPQTSDEVLHRLTEFFSIDLSPTRVKSQFQKLCASNKLVCISSPKGEMFKVTEAYAKEIEKDLADAKALEDTVRQKFIDVFSSINLPIQPEQIWNNFREWLFNLIRKMGATTYEFISSRVLKLDGDDFDEFVKQYPVHLQDAIRETIVSFVDPADQNIRSFVLRFLNAYLLVEGVNLPEKSLLNLSAALKKSPSFIVFIDTNFLFSILELHENPANEAARFLMQLSSQLSSKVKVKFYVLPITLEEAKSRLISEEIFLDQMRPVPKLTRAAQDSRLRIAGLARKYFEAASKDTKGLSPKEYFAPYIHDLLAFLRDKGVLIFNENLEKLKLAPQVIDDITGSLKFEEQKYGSRAKGYKSLEHDVVLWHFVNSKRAAYVESPLETVYWIVTIDNHFLGYDAYKRNSTHFPICIHPSTFVQMLQLWTPRTPEFEQVVLNSLRQAFFQDFDPNAERVTINILKALSRFENIDNVSEETLVSIVFNDALRQKLEDNDENIEEQISLVKLALIEEHDKLQMQLNSERRDKEKALHEIGKKAQETSDLAFQLSQTREQLQQTKMHLVNIETEKKLSQEAAKVTRLRIQFVLQSVLAFIGVFAGIGLGSFLIGHFGRTLSVGIYLVVLSLLLAVWLWWVTELGKKNIVIAEWEVFAKVCKFRKWIFRILAAIITAMIVSILKGMLGL